MNELINKCARNFSYTMISNLISVVLNLLVLLILPKILSVADYSYYQLYIFYGGYIGFFHLGWCDGIYLRYGGEEYKNLNKQVITSQFWSLTFFESVISIVLYIFVVVAITDGNKTIILNSTIFTIMLILPKTMISYILQATNRIREYAIIIVIEKIVFLIIIIILLFMQIQSYTPIIFCDILSKLCSLVIACYLCKDIIVAKVHFNISDIKETMLNLKIGSKLMIANIAGSLILGVIRMAIETHWSIEVFGKISLSITFSNLLMLFITSISIVLFPMLRRFDLKKIKEMYPIMRTVLMVCLLGLLALYFPISYFLSSWLPQYNESISYMAILFPVCIYESKMAMIINTYLKTLRKESTLLYVNLITLILSVMLTIFNVFILNDLNLTIISIIVLFSFRSVMCEFFLSKYLALNVGKDIFLELLLTLCFIMISWYIGGMVGFVLYMLVYIFYLVFKKADLLNVYHLLKRLK